MRHTSRHSRFPYHRGGEKGTFVRSWPSINLAGCCATGGKSDNIRFVIEFSTSIEIHARITPESGDSTDLKSTRTVVYSFEDRQSDMA